MENHYSDINTLLKTYHGRKIKKRTSKVRTCGKYEREDTHQKWHFIKEDLYPFKELRNFTCESTPFFHIVLTCLSFIFPILSALITSCCFTTLSLLDNTSLYQFRIFTCFSVKQITSSYWCKVDSNSLKWW